MEMAQGVGACPQGMNICNSGHPTHRKTQPACNSSTQEMAAGGFLGLASWLD